MVGCATRVLKASTNDTKGLTIIIWILVFLFVPETGRLTLEEIDDIFISKTTAWKTSLKQNKKENLSQHLNPSAGRSCSYDAVVPGKNSKLVYSCDAKGKVNLGAALLWSEVKFSVPPDR